MSSKTDVNNFVRFFHISLRPGVSPSDEYDLAAARLSSYLEDERKAGRTIIAIRFPEPSLILVVSQRPGKDVTIQ